MAKNEIWVTGKCRVLYKNKYLTLGLEDDDGNWSETHLLVGNDGILDLTKYFLKVLKIPVDLGSYKV